jgi:hypothetical protein
MALFDTSGKGHHSQGIYFEVKGLEKAIAKLEELKHIDRKKARQFKSGLRRAAKPMVSSVRDSITSSKNKTAYTATIQTKRSKDPAKRKYKDVTYKSGNLKKSIAFFPSRKRGALLGYVGARTGRRAGKTFDGYYAAIVNYGVGRGKAKAKPDKKENIDYSIKGHQKGKAMTEKLLYREVQNILKKSLYELSR